MKIQENYFYKLDNLKEVKVIWKKYDKANILEIGIDYPTAIVDLDRLSGIKLTDEWLLKCGFIKKEKENFNNILCEYSKGLFCFTYLKTSGKLSVYFGIQRFDDGHNLRYVHQLQNLYFALTNKELTINL